MTDFLGPSRSTGSAPHPSPRCPTHLLADSWTSSFDSRPGVNQLETKRAFWNFIAQGMETDTAALECGVSQYLGPRWFREAGGMPPIKLAPDAGSYLSFSEREEIALLRAEDCGVREIARRLQR